MPTPYRRQAFHQALRPPATTIFSHPLGTNPSATIGPISQSSAPFSTRRKKELAGRACGGAIASRTCWRWRRSTGYGGGEIRCRGERRIHDDDELVDPTRTRSRHLPPARLVDLANVLRQANDERDDIASLAPRSRRFTSKDRDRHYQHRTVPSGRRRLRGRRLKPFGRRHGRRIVLASDSRRQFPAGRRNATARSIAGCAASPEIGVRSY